MVRFLDRKDEIRSALVNVAKNGVPVTYETFGDGVGIWRMRGAKDVLDLIANEERANSNPDITFMLYSATTDYPSQIGGQSAKPPTQAQKQLARNELQAVIDRYCPGAENPY